MIKFFTDRFYSAGTMTLVWIGVGGYSWTGNPWYMLIGLVGMLIPTFRWVDKEYVIACAVLCQHDYDEIKTDAVALKARVDHLHACYNKNVEGV